MKYWKNIPEKYWVLSDQAVVSGSAFFTNMLLARALGLEEYGRFSALVMIQLFVLSINMAFSSQVYQVAYPSLGDIDKQKLTNGMLSLQSIPVVVILVGSMIYYLNWKAVDHNILMAALTTVLYLLQDFLRRAFITQIKSKYALLIDCLTNFIQIIALLFVWYFLVLDQFMAWSIIGLSFVPSVITGVFLLRPKAIYWSTVRYAWKLQTQKGGWLVGSSLLQWGSGYFYVLAAGWWLGPTALGALRLAQYIFGLLNLLLQAIENYVLPRAAAMNNTDPGRWRRLMGKCLIMIVPFLCIFSFFAEDIFRISGHASTTSYTFVIYGLSFVYLLITVGYPIRIAIRSLELNKHYFIGYVLSVGIGLLIAPWLIKNWALHGVLVGIFTTQFIMLTYWLIILQRKHSILWKSYI
jgi:O-antigen/teichoic acid export membrane protein